MKKYLAILFLLLLTAVLSFGWKQVKDRDQPETMELIPMMRLLLADIYTVNEGIYTGNFELVEEGGNSIARHPAMTSEDKKLIQGALANEFNRFVHYDRVVHHHADSLALAAQGKDMEAVLKHYHIVQQGCVDCHTDFRSRVIEAKK